MLLLGDYKHRNIYRAIHKTSKSTYPNHITLCSSCPIKPDIDTRLVRHGQVRLDHRPQQCGVGILKGIKVLEQLHQRVAGLCEGILF